MQTNIINITINKQIVKKNKTNVLLKNENVFCKNYKHIKKIDHNKSVT